jgi:hypothetical protein
MHSFVGADETTLQKLNGIITIAELLVDFTNVGASALGGGDAGDSLFSLVRALADTKTLACGKNYRSFRAENLCKRKNTPPSSARRLCPSSTRQKLALWTTSSTGRRGARWGRSRPSSMSTAPLTDLTNAPP